jgi:hypothetical protein
VSDRLEIELSYETTTGEQIKLLGVNGKAPTGSYNDLRGTTSVGEFGSLLASIFVPQTEAIFKEGKHDNLRGRDTVIYDFRIKKSNSPMTIRGRNSGQLTTVGYSGRIWIDSDTRRVLRIEASAEGIPQALVITLQESAIEYDWVRIEGEKYLLPVHAELLIGVDAQKVYWRNVIEFVNYHKWEGKIKIADPKQN